MFEKGNKIFLSYAHTGESETEVTQRMKSVCDALREAGVVPYCNLFDEQISHYSTPGQYILGALNVVKESDGFIMLKTNRNRSEGQYTEFGAALSAGIPRAYLLHESARESTYLDDPLLMDKTVVWSSEGELIEAAKGLVL